MSARLFVVFSEAKEEGGELMREEAVLEKALSTLLSDAKSALVALQKMAKVGILEEKAENGRYSFYLPRCWFHCHERRYGRGWRFSVWPVLVAQFTVDDESNVTHYRWGEQVYSPPAFLASLLAREREKMQGISKLQDVGDVDTRQGDVQEKQDVGDVIVV